MKRSVYYMLYLGKQIVLNIYNFIKITIVSFIFLKINHFLHFSTEIRFWIKFTTVILKYNLRLFYQPNSNA